MKKTILLLFVTVTLGFTGLAQGLSIGPRLGANLAHIQAVSGDDQTCQEINDNTKQRQGLVAGVVFNLGRANSFSLQPELLLSQLGTVVSVKSSVPGSTGQQPASANYTRTVRMNYLQVPVLAKFGFDWEGMVLFINAGPYGGYALSTSSKFEADGQTKQVAGFDNTSLDDGIIDNRLDIGVAAGIGVGIPVDNRLLTIDLCYSHSFSDLTTYTTQRPVNALEASHRSLSISLSYLLPVGNRQD